MDSETNINQEKKKSEQTELQEQYLQSFQPIKEGELVSGKIVEITTDFIFVDVGYKSEGKIKIEEFEAPPRIGDIVDVIIVRKESSDGSVIVSKKKADEKVFWKTLKVSFNEQSPVEGKIVRSIKGGYEVDLGYDVRAFMPLSKSDVQHVVDIESLIGKESLFKIERLYSEGKLNIVVSRRAWLEEEITKRKDKFFDTVQIGDVIKGNVKSFTAFGAFIDIGGFDGLLHINDMSWGHVTKPKDLIKKGQELELKVIKVDPEEKRINLSLKHMKDDPWDNFEDKYSVGDIVSGRVTKLTNFGAFIEIEEGIEGLAHISELSWVKKIRHPKEVLREGDNVDVKILSFDLEMGKVSLGLKQVNDNPWDDIEDRYPVGMRIKRKVKNISNFGAFLEIEEGIDGLLHLDDFSWTTKYNHPSELLNPGDEIEVMVIDLDKKNQKIKLGLKQLSEDPWDSLTKAFSRGSIIEGTITTINEYGIFLKVQGDIEGLIPQQHVFDQKTETYEEAVAKFNIGDTLKALIIDIKSSRQKLTLSLRDYYRMLQKEEIAKYIHDEEDEDKVSIADFIKKSGSDEE
ncbi:MAG: 30S ribosomal protein S1 [Spirochaetales bacterium]|nr:30S ribosomal protein S1 [Spirochaetales bacterium]